MYKLTATITVVCAGVVIAVLSSPSGVGNTVAVAEVSVPTANSNCLQVFNVQDYRSYASRVYTRDKVSKKAHNRMLRMTKCQRRASGPKAIKRYHKKYKQAREARQEARRIASLVFPVRAHLRSIAQCESGGNIKAVSGNGMYYGKYQFSFATWASVGGRGNPASASEYEQDKRAEMLYRRSGPGQWPVCQGR